MHETVPTMKHPRRFGQLPNLAVPDTVDDPLPRPEVDAWEGNSPCSPLRLQPKPTSHVWPNVTVTKIHGGRGAPRRSVRCSLAAWTLHLRHKLIRHSGATGTGGGPAHVQGAIVDCELADTLLENGVRDGDSVDRILGPFDFQAADAAAQLADPSLAAALFGATPVVQHQWLMYEMRFGHDVVSGYAPWFSGSRLCRNALQHSITRAH